MTVKSGSTLEGLLALSFGEAEFCAVVKGGQVGLSLRSIFMDLGIPMKVEIKSYSSTAKYLTDPLGENESKMDTSLSRRFLQRKIVQM